MEHAETVVVYAYAGDAGAPFALLIPFYLFFPPSFCSSYSSPSSSCSTRSSPSSSCSSIAPSSSCSLSLRPLHRCRDRWREATSPRHVGRHEGKGTTHYTAAMTAKALFLSPHLLRQLRPFSTVHRLSARFCWRHRSCWRRPRLRRVPGRQSSWWRRPMCDNVPELSARPNRLRTALPSARVGSRSTVAAH